MAQALWHVSNYPSTATAASASQAASPDLATVNRARHITFSAAGAAAVATGIIKCVVRDGDASTGTIIWSGTLQALANDSASLVLQDIDLRASSGNAITAETTGAGGTGTQLSVSMVGDVVQIGKPGFFP